jgi:polyisoprenoid-binding protein YceI
MSKSLFVSIALVLLLAACTSQPVQTESSDNLIPSATGSVEPASRADETGYPAPVQAQSGVSTADSGFGDDSAYPEPADSTGSNPTSPPVTSGDLAYPSDGTFFQSFQIVPGESQVSYEVGETLLNENNRFNIAIGVSKDVTGEILIDRDNPQNSMIRAVNVDISRFESDSPRRDNFIREQFLESAEFPIATFIPFEIQGLPETYQEGEELSLQITGDLTVHQITKPVTFEVSLQLQGDSLNGEATTTILMSDFGVGPISLAGILNTEDEVKLKLEFVARP